MKFEKLLPTGVRRLWISPDQPSSRLVDLLGAQLGGHSASHWRRQIDQQRVWIDAQPVRVATRSIPGGTLLLLLGEHTDRWSLIEQQGSLAAFYKPPGQLFDQAPLHVLPSPGWGFVHRLDKMTSGLLLVAQTDAIAQLQRKFAQHQVRKSYLAFTWSLPAKRQGLFQAALLKRASAHGGARVHTVSQDQPGAQRATTAWRVLAHRAGISLLECHPQSGRTHQLRAHLQAMGSPLIGDGEYQTPLPIKPWRGNIATYQHMLHAWKVEFEWQGGRVSWSCPLSPDFLRLCRWIGFEPEPSVDR